MIDAIHNGTLKGMVEAGELVSTPIFGLRVLECEFTCTNFTASVNAVTELRSPSRFLVFRVKSLTLSTAGRMRLLTSSSSSVWLVYLIRILKSISRNVHLE